MAIWFRGIIGYLFVVAFVFGVLSLMGKFDGGFARLAKNGTLALRLRLAFGSGLLVLSVALLLALFFADDVLLFCNSHNVFSFDTIVTTLSTIVLLGGVLILFGKADWLISLYVYVSDDKLADYHLWRLRLLAMIDALSIYACWTNVIDEKLDKNAWGHGIVAVFVVVWLLSMIFGRKWARKK